MQAEYDEESRRPRQRMAVARIAALTSTLLLAAMLSNPSPAYAALTTTVNLGAAASFSLFSGASVANTGRTYVSGDVGVSPGASITGFDGPPLSGTMGGTPHVDDTLARQAQIDLTAAYNEVEARPGGIPLAGDQIGATHGSGLYFFGGAFANTGTMTLNGGGRSKCDLRLPGRRRPHHGRG